MKRHMTQHGNREQKNHSNCAAGEREQLMARDQRLHDAAVFQALAALGGLLARLGRGGRAKKAADAPRLSSAKGPRHGWAAR